MPLDLGLSPGPASGRPLERLFLLLRVAALLLLASFVHPSFAALQGTVSKSKMRMKASNLFHGNVLPQYR